jgi:DNA sulfur modification protein DndD
MIIDEIVLHNVGVFHGEQRAVLTPPSHQRPVVLFGGLNGAGKTTLLEAMQLALYGKHASTGRRAGVSYDDYLRRLINRNVHPSDGASVEMHFSVNDQGQAKALRVRRAWRATDSRVTESLEVYRDGEFDLGLTESWGDHASRIIPPQLSTLFFFDGERIEALADPERSSEVLLSAINALLGVDLVEQLQSDLLALERRKLSEKRSEPERERIVEAERKIRDLEARLQDHSQENAQLKGQSEQAESKLAKLEQEFIRQGGRLAENRHTVEGERELLHDQVNALRLQLSVLAGRDLPLLIVKPLLVRTLEQAQRELETEKRRMIHSTIAQRDERILRAITKKVAQPKLARDLKAIFEEDRKQFELDDQQVTYLGLPTAGRSRLASLCQQDLERQAEDAKAVMTELVAAEIKLEGVDRRLAAVPDSEAIAKLVNERNSVRGRIDEMRVRMQVANEQSRLIERELGTLRQNLDLLLRDGATARLETDDLGRFLKHSEKARHTLERFRVTVTKRHSRRLERLIYEGFRQLLRKQSLVHGIHIEPETCQLRLLNATGDELPAERLSAGERQLLAVSILWGLAKACGRPLPVVIDTPLGRLDSSHRKHLVERYFPFASHQVILLSTDEEIDERYLNMIKPYVGRSYRLVHNEELNGTEIESGYFWAEASAC